MIKNMKIRTRMLLSYLVIIALCIAASVTALVMMKKISANLESFYDNNFTVTVHVWKARREMQYARADILKSLLETDEESIEEAIDGASKALTNMRGAFPVISKRFKGDISLMNEVESILNEAIVYRDEIFELVRDNRKEEAFAVMKGSYVPLLNQMSDVLMEISNQAENNAVKMVQQGQRIQAAFTGIVIAIIGFSAAFAALLGLYISNGIRKPVEEIRSAAENLAAGNLAVSIHYQSKDELGDLSNSIRSLIKTFLGIIKDMSEGLSALSIGDFTIESKEKGLYVGDFKQLESSMYQIIDKLSKTLEQINQASEQVSSGSELVASGAQELSQGAVEQAGSVEELAGALNDITSQIKNNAQSAQKGSRLAEAAGIKIEECNSQMRELIEAMEEINDKSSQISRINKVIKDIAFQTNILALNAAVEAAHAGAAGKGFAVVANEVRNLATKSAEASKNTTALIQGSIESVENGTKLADKTARTLIEIVENAKQLSEVVDDISHASGKQSDSITLIAREIEQITSVVQTNSATAEEEAAASEELSGQALMLRDLISQFKLKQGLSDDFNMRG